MLISVSAIDCSAVTDTAERERSITSFSSHPRAYQICRGSFLCTCLADLARCSIWTVLEKRERNITSLPAISEALQVLLPCCKVTSPSWSAEEVRVQV